jgi:alpha-ribazole phosphatase
MVSLAVTRWWWIRHAPVVDAHLGRMSGQADVEADVSDLKSFKTLAAHLPNDAVWMVSALKRTHQTAQALFEAGAERTDVKIEPAFDEQAFGDWTNKTWDDVGVTDEAQAFWNDPALQRPPGDVSESFDEVCRRVSSRINQITQSHMGRDIVCIAHAGSIRAAIALALGLTPEQALSLEVKNITLTRLDFISDDAKGEGQGGWRMLGLNQCGEMT